MQDWSEDEIRLTRFAWAMQDADRALRRGIVVDALVAAGSGVAMAVLVALVVLLAL